MKITVGQIYQGLGVLRNFANQKFPDRAVSFRLGRFVDTLNAEYNRTNDLRNELLDEYGERVENEAGMVSYSFAKVERSRAKEHDKKWADLCAVEINIEISPIRIEDIPIEMMPTANDLAYILWIFTDPETSTAPEKAKKAKG